MGGGDVDDVGGSSVGVGVGVGVGGGAEDSGGGGVSGFCWSAHGDLDNSLQRRPVADPPARKIGQPSRLLLKICVSPCPAPPRAPLPVFE